MFNRKTLPDADRKFDTTALSEKSHGHLIHRDYAAHFFRWGFVRRFIKGEQTEMLDVGCGAALPLLNVLAFPPNIRPAKYVGVDYSPAPRKINRQIAQLHWEFDFTARHAELGQFDLVTCFEVIEHMRKEDGEKLLAGIKACLRPDGVALLSTPNFNGKAAVNHIHEWGYEEIKEAFDRAGLWVVAHHGTFMNVNTARRVCTKEELAVMDGIRRFYSDDVAACFLAPLYPQHARNIVWVLRHTHQQAAE